MIFENRIRAGQRLAEHLLHHKGEDGIVLALPRGGVPVGYEVAQSLDFPLDIVLVRKLGAPIQPELAMGAIASGGVRVLNDDVISMLQIDDESIERVASVEQQELERRERVYREDRPPADVEGRTVILVDDGIATGATTRAAVLALQDRQARKVVIAVPVAPSDTIEMLGELVDEVVCLETPEPFGAIGRFYVHFEPVLDDDVRDLLRRAALSATNTKATAGPAQGTQCGAPTRDRGTRS